MANTKAAATSKPAGTNISPKAPKPLYFILAMLALTLFTFLPMLSGEKQFTNWDDDGYVTDQPLVQSLDGEHISKIFDPASVVQFNYHPLTMLSLAIDYARGDNEEGAPVDIAPFASTNLMLHLLNTLLVFLLLYRLSNRQVWVATIAAAIFGTHPMHVESVAWISERKDLLYCFFFLLSMLAYLRYTDTGKWSMFGLSLLFFIASCLSKAMAVPLPMVLLLTDYLIKRKFTARVWLEKLPYFIISIIVGLYAIKVQEDALGGVGFDAGQRLVLAGYGYCMYLLRFFVPVNLSAYYPYPADNIIPGYYYAALLVALAVVVIIMVLAIRKHSQGSRLLWGIGFFTLMTALVLQFITVGSSAMNDRYTYVSYIGLCFVLASFIGNAVAQAKYRNIAMIGTACFVVFLAATSYARIPVWDNSGALWMDVVKKHPIHEDGKINMNVKTPYKNLGDHYASAQQFDSAYIYYKLLTDNHTKDAEVWSNIGNIYVFRNDMPKALAAFDTSLQLYPKNAETWFKRGLAHSFAQNFAAAVKDMDEVLRLDPNNKEAVAFRQKFSAMAAQPK